MSDGNNLKEKLFYFRKNGWENIDSLEKNEIFNFCNEYINFLNIAKTEREIIKFSRELAEKNGFSDIINFEKLNPGDKVFYMNRDKSMYLAVIGNDNLDSGLNIIGSHGDSPRLDLKPNPLYEDNGFAYFKTHYYGGIKKYQWTTIPLAIHGVVVKPTGEKIEICIGEDECDPVFTITDLLPHLAQEQMEKKLKEAISGENLNILIGSIPYNEKDLTEKVKLNILNILNEKYGITEIDFLSSEIELVPAFRTRSLGFDSSMIAGYGQDDKVCVFTSLKAMMEIENPNTTAICIISDKEEIGSVGNTGMESKIFDRFIGEILNKLQINKPNMIDTIFSHSKMLSADVDTGFDPIYASVSEVNNSSFLGRGVALNKYSGSRGKSGSSDANAEYLGYIRRIFEENNILYQIAELGKVDVGGGGTIAYILANKGVEVVDCGVPVLSMHSPYEVTSKFDIFSAYKFYKCFWK